MNWWRKKIGKDRQAARDQRMEQYRNCPSDPAGRLAVQLEKFNLCWRQIQLEVPFYRDLVEKGQAPRRLDRWDQLLENFPVVNRPMLYQHCSELSNQKSPPEYLRITGGSTGSPIQLPAWNSEIKQTNSDIWTGRKWYDIDPQDSLFLIWGHRHLLGRGWQGWKNAQRRRLQDRVLGYTRYPAYDLSPAAMKHAWDLLLQTDSKYVIGYSVALDRFAQANLDRPWPHRSPLKAAIATAESFPFPDSAQRLAGLLKTRVAMEYGAVETGLLAHSHPDGGFRVFFLNYFLEATEQGPSGGYILRVTSLFPRCFPLIRYEIGDEITRPGPGIGISSFSEVLGRCNNYLEWNDGLKIHSEAITHSLSPVAAISGYQMLQEKEYLRLCLTLRSPLDERTRDEILAALTKINPRLAATNIQIVDKLEQTVAGKTPMVVRRP